LYYCLSLFGELVLRRSKIEDLIKVAVSISAQHQSKVVQVIEAKKARFEVRWEFHNDTVQRARAQSERLDGYLDGFADGVLIALEIPSGCVYQKFRSHVVVRNLGKEKAIRLANIIGELYRPLSRKNGGVYLKRQGLTPHFRYGGIGS
jgi:hypothetical protein